MCFSFLVRKHNKSELYLLKTHLQENQRNNIKCVKDHDLMYQKLFLEVMKNKS